MLVFRLPVPLASCGATFAGRHSRPFACKQAPTRLASTGSLRFHFGYVNFMVLSSFQGSGEPDERRSPAIPRPRTKTQGADQPAGVLHLGGDHRRHGAVFGDRAGNGGDRLRQRQITGDQRRRLVLRAHRGDHHHPGDLSGGEPLRRHQAGQGSLRAGLQLHLLVRDAVLRRHGHRSYVLRRRRAGDPLHRAADGGPGHHRGRQGSDARHLLPLGAARLEHLRHRRPDSRLLQFPARPAADAALGALPTDRQENLRPAGPRGGHLRGGGHGVRRRHLAGLRRRAGQRRA